MTVQILHYPPCTTCKRALKWLKDHDISYDARNIKEDNPTAAELKEWIAKNNFPVRKLFNTSGLVYKSLELKDKLDGMTEDEQLDLLATDGMLVKRPLVIGKDFLMAGFKEAEWENKLTHNSRQ